MIIKEEAGHREMSWVTRHTRYSFVPEKKKEPLPWMGQARGTEKPNEKSIYPGSILENYIPEDVHTSFHIIKKGDILPKLKSAFKVFIINSGKEQYSPREL